MEETCTKKQTLFKFPPSEYFSTRIFEIPQKITKPLFRFYRGVTGGFLLLQNFSVAISVSPHVCFILVLILISMFLR